MLVVIIQIEDVDPMRVTRYHVQQVIADIQLTDLVVFAACSGDLTDHLARGQIDNLHAARIAILADI